jgi:hypothetical protein
MGLGMSPLPLKPIQRPVPFAKLVPLFRQFRASSGVHGEESVKQAALGKERLFPLRLERRRLMPAGANGSGLPEPLAMLSRRAKPCRMTF